MRARDFEIPFSGETGQYNAITDVKGVEVGYTTLIDGKGPLVVGKGPIRTGVTVILPTGKKGILDKNSCFAAWYNFNGNGEMTGTAWIDESGTLYGPIAITNTHSVGTVRDAIIKYFITKKIEMMWLLPVVAETYDGFMNDIDGFHVKEEHLFEAIETATTGPLKEGNVGGGTGMTCHGFKGGTGTSSRVIKIGDQTYTIGVLVQANYGERKYLTIAGVPIGTKIEGFEAKYYSQGEANKMESSKKTASLQKEDTKRDGSIIVIVATDAPLLPHQLKKLAKRVPLGVGRVGGYGANSSGDLFLTFSTANILTTPHSQNIIEVKSLRDNLLNKLYVGTIEATEEAIVNALISAKTMEGINGNMLFQIPHDQVEKIFSKSTEEKVI